MICVCAYAQMRKGFSSISRTTSKTLYSKSLPYALDDEVLYIALALVQIFGVKCSPAPRLGQGLWAAI